MGFRTFIAGEILTAAYVNDYLMKQANIVCTSGTRPSSPPEGMEVYETDTKRKMLWTGSAWVNMTTVGDWTSYTPTWTGATTNPSVGNGVLQGRYKIMGDVVHVFIRAEFGSTTTAGSGPWSFALPVNPATQDILPALAVDSAPTGRYAGTASLSTGGSVDRVVAPGGSGVTGIGSTVPFTWANGDYLIISGSYQAAA